jgi:hypothetical protein
VDARSGRFGVEGRGATRPPGEPAPVARPEGAGGAGRLLRPGQLLGDDAGAGLGAAGPGGARPAAVAPAGPGPGLGDPGGPGRGVRRGEEPGPLRRALRGRAGDGPVPGPRAGVVPGQPGRVDAGRAWGSTRWRARPRAPARTGGAGTGACGAPSRSCWWGSPSARRSPGGLGRDGARPEPRPRAGGVGPRPAPGRGWVVWARAGARVARDGVFWAALAGTTAACGWLGRRPHAHRRVAVALGIIALAELGLYGHALLEVAPAGRFLGPDPVGAAVGPGPAPRPVPRPRPGSPSTTTSAPSASAWRRRTSTTRSRSSTPPTCTRRCTPCSIPGRTRRPGSRRTAPAPGPGGRSGRGCSTGWASPC